MTIKELIAKLQTMDQDMTVVCHEAEFDLYMEPAVYVEEVDTNSISESVPYGTSKTKVVVL